jgi:uncharacterized protein (TIGR02391 family)
LDKLQFAFRLYRSTSLPNPLLATPEPGGELQVIKADLRRAIYLSKTDVDKKEWFRAAGARLRSEKPHLLHILERGPSRISVAVFTYARTLANLVFVWGGNEVGSNIHGEEYLASTSESAHAWLGDTERRENGYFLLGFSPATDLWRVHSLSPDVNGKLVFVLDQQLTRVDTREPKIRRLTLEGLHPRILEVASDLFTDEHYSQAILEAVKVVEQRVKEQSGLTNDYGASLMGKAFRKGSGSIQVAHESGKSGEDEQEGFMHLFMGAAQAIKNPKSHETVTLKDPQRAIEYLGFLSLLMRRLDDARESSR